MPVESPCGTGNVLLNMKGKASGEKENVEDQEVWGVQKNRLASFEEKVTPKSAKSEKKIRWIIRQKPQSSKTGPKLIV